MKLYNLFESDNIGKTIKHLCAKIYNQGDDEFEYFYHDSPIFAQYWDQYEGDLDSIIAEVDPGELQVMLDEIESYVEQAGLEEVKEANPNQQASLWHPETKTYRHERIPTSTSVDVDDITARGRQVDFPQHHELSRNKDIQSPEDTVYKSDLKRLVAQQFKTLPNNIREVLKLRFWDGMTIDQIGRQLGIKPEQVRQIEAKGMRMLKHSSRLGGMQSESSEQGVAEEWSQKYKDSINCSNPKGFSQKAHCAGKKKHNESVKENRAYYNVIGTPDSELRSTFGMRKDRNGWFLSENVDKRKQLAAFRAFGAPKLKEYNLASFSGSAAIKGEDNVISPVGSGRKGK